MNKVERVRLAVFKLWFLTLGVILLTFGVKFSGVQGVQQPFSSVFQSLQMMVGLVIPQIAVITAFYLTLDRQEPKITALSKPQITVITWLSAMYHLAFNASLVFGVLFQRFDTTADGSSLQRNTAAVVAIMGLLSILLAPVAFLFASPQKPPRATGRSTTPAATTD